MSPTARRIVTAALLVGTFLASLEVSVVGAAMPTIVERLGGTALYAWAFSAYLLVQTLTTPMYGMLADRAGRRTAYLIGIVAFLAGSVICALATSMPMFVAGRAVQGLGAGSILPLTMTLFGDLWPVDQRTRLQGLFSLVWGVSSALGPLVGGVLTDAWSWHAIFWLNVPPGIVAGVVIAVLVPAELGRGALVQAGGGFAAIVRDPTIQAVSLSGLLLGASLYGIIGYLPVWVQAVHGGSALDAGLALLPLSLAWTLASNIGGRIVGRLGFRVLVRGGTLLVAVGGVLAAIWPDGGVGFVLFGLGMGFTIASFTVSSQEAAPPGLRGTATSLVLFSRSIGAAVGVSIFGWVAGFRPGVEGLGAIPGLEAGVGTVFVAVAACAIGALAIVWARFPRSPTGARGAAGPATR